MTTQDALLRRIEDEHVQWQQLRDAVGEARMEEPGPMGAWSFKDLAAHLTGWRERTIRRLAAPPGTEPPPLWPAALTDDDAINQWIYACSRHRPLQQMLTEADESSTRLAAAIRSLPAVDVDTPRRFAWLVGRSLAETDSLSHFHEEHEGTVQVWLAERGPC